MSYVLTSFVNCETLQSQLNDHFLCDYTKTIKASETSLVSYLFSPLNTANTLQSQIGGNGKVKDVKLVYTPRIPLGAVDTSITPADCSSTNDAGQRSATYTIDENVGVQIDRRIDTEDLIRLCQDNGSFVSNMVAQMMDAAVRRMDQLIAAQAIALAGDYGTNETNVTAGFKTIRTRLTSSSPSLSTNFISQIDFAAENAGYCNAPAVFGYHELYSAFKELNAANCCADSGTNIAQLNSLAGTMFMPNKNITTVFNNTNQAIMVDAGALQVLTYNRYLVNDQVMTVNDATTQRTVIYHPTLGIPFDFKADYSCGVWSFFVSLAFKTVGVPDDIYEVEDIYSGVTGVNKLVVNNA
jgi:hypothetical protein